VSPGKDCSQSPETEALVGRIVSEFDDAKRNALLTQLHEMMNEQALMILVAHDLNPRALWPKLKCFVQARSWFQDLRPIVVAP
jgi:peptide/nickel transport system substrate-binding protein